MAARYNNGKVPLACSRSATNNNNSSSSYVLPRIDKKPCIYQSIDYGVESVSTSPKYAIRIDPKEIQRYSNNLACKHRKEAFLQPVIPFMRFGNLGDDTHNWKRELKKMALRLGIITFDEFRNDPNMSAEFKRNIMTKHALKTQPAISSYTYNDTVDKKKQLDVVADNSSKKLCLSKLVDLDPENRLIICNDDHDRESWLLEIMSQALMTKSFQELMVWLVSSDAQEKEAMQKLILSALRRIDHSDRIVENNVCFLKVGNVSLYAVPI